ncbi:P-loop containing nucleoside triphosphate hydrolase protein [Abortiporus biennis]|nr:P-loop containing nucleoside triphosphate hydrolase protein [Abortiporus biennis]
MLSASPTNAPITFNDGTDKGVGLSDPHLASGRRKMLDLVNRLHSTGVQLDIDLPMIAVIGSQSAGKSSLIESISGITLPRASGTCTRVPTECRLTSSTSPWKCTISLRFITDANGQPLRQVRNETFGDAIFDKSEVEERIRRAQRAILNPSTSFRTFLDGPDEDPVDRELTFSINCVSLQISGQDVADLSFVDLPGLIASVGKGGNESDIELVKKLVTNYIERPSCIILLTVACETDFENQGAHRLTKQYDPEGKRTVGVLTKPDRIPSGEEDRWLRFIRNEYESLDNGWFSVKQPDTKALQAGITWSEARAAEREFFSLTSSWSALDYSYQQRLGTTNLTECLSTILSGLIARRLPELQDELQKLLQKTEDSLRQIPKPPSSDALGEILHLLSNFSRDLSTHLEGTPDEKGLLQTIRPAQEAFKRAIRETAPDFRPYERPSRTSLEDSSDESDSGDGSNSDSRAVQPPSFLSSEEAPVISRNDNNAIFVDEVMKRAQDAITRELPDHYPFVVSREYIHSFTALWRVPMRNLFDVVIKVLVGYIKALVIKHFNKYAHGGLQSHIVTLVTDYIKTCSSQALDRITWLLDLEMRPLTLNGHYYSDYRDKFLAHYRGCRKTGSSTGDLSNKLDQYGKSPIWPGRKLTSSQTSFNESTSKILSGLSEIGISGVKATDLPRLLPSDPYEPALHIMASVRAYFQVAYKRFADNVPMAIDHELILGLDRDRALENALRKGLGITGPDGYQRCKDFLQEPPNVVARRDELQKKLDRLEAAKKELLDLWL